MCHRRATDATTGDKVLRSLIFLNLKYCLKAFRVGGISATVICLRPATARQVGRRYMLQADS